MIRTRTQWRTDESQIVIATFSKLIGPDLILIAIIIGIPVAIALPIIFFINRRSKKPPPLSGTGEGNKQG